MKIKTATVEIENTTFGIINKNGRMTVVVGDTFCGEYFTDAPLNFEHEALYREIAVRMLQHATGVLPCGGDVRPLVDLLTTIAYA